MNISEYMNKDKGVIKSNKLIYVDMDGVIVDFNKGFKLLKGSGGITATEYEDIHGKDSIWKVIDNYDRRKFFSNLPWTYDGQKLWNFISKKFKNIKILTALGRSDEIHKNTSNGKREWLGKNIPSLTDENIIMVQNKHAKKHWSFPDMILVDDREVVIDGWNSKGGIGILHKNTHQTIKKLKEVI